ncbi:MAG: TetR/AcrR family transcriptional regulator [Candidatus Brocadiia bacterium]
MTDISRKERERAEHRSLILEAAEEVFAEHGFHGATVQQIAEAAEFSVGYLYNHFESKEDLFLQLVDLRAAQLLDDVAQCVQQDGEPADRVRGAIDAKMAFFRRHRRFFLIFSHAVAEERAGGQPCFSERMRRRYRQYLQELAGVMAEGIRRGVFVKEDPMTMATCMEGMTNAVIGYWVHTGGEEPGAATPDVIQRIFLSGVLAEGNGS